VMHYALSRPVSWQTGSIDPGVDVGLAWQRRRRLGTAGEAEAAEIDFCAAVSLARDADRGSDIVRSRRLPSVSSRKTPAACANDGSLRVRRQVSGNGPGARIGPMNGAFNVGSARGERAARMPNNLGRISASHRDAMQT